jgi:cytochrome P450/NADPH-cytochrome P450 reductase
VGNLPDVDPEKGVFGMVDLAREYGPLFRLEVFGRSLLVAARRSW